MKITHLIALFTAFAVAPTLRAQTATQVWATRYAFSPPTASDDRATAVTVDSAGNVIVTGYLGAFGDSYFYTAKYAGPNGALLWEKRHIPTGAGPGYLTNMPASVAVDAAGNVFVTGMSNGLDSRPNYYTAKYAAADGALLWEVRYAAPGPNGCRPRRVAVDAGGNAIVTGYSNGNYYTAKYAGADGALLWEVSYAGPDSNDGAYDLALDAAGNVAVTGGSSDIYTAKYAAANGALLWEKHYDGPGHRSDIAYSVAVDAGGNVIVAGSTDLAPNVQDCLTAKFAASDGTLLWQTFYHGPGSAETYRGNTAFCVAVDAAGDVFVTGSSRLNPTGDEDFYTAKYDGGFGTLLWEKRYNGPVNGNDSAQALAVDAAGNVVVMGTSYNGSNNSVFYTAKYAAGDGTLLWEARYSGLGGNQALGTLPSKRPLAITADGGAVIAGASVNNNTGSYDFATIRYAAPAGDADGDGLQDWWEQIWWTTTAGHSALDDFDHDGIPELLEMAFGLNPKQPDTLPTAVNEGGYLTITITKHPGVAYQVQTAATPDAPAFSPATTTVLADNAATLKVRDNILIGTPSSRYLRVKVTAVP